MTEPQIELHGIQKHYGAFHALRDVSLTVPAGRFVALVGPSGCGKSTLLRVLAGLETIAAGRIRIAGRDVTHLPPRLRDLAMVFQSYALYPHLTVEQNLTYALRLRGVPRAECRRRAEEIAAITGLQSLLGRYPRELSGGQRQRVAMGRAIIREPRAFLFDEPLSNLDAALRVQMRSEIRKLHDRLGATSVYVTHDQIEAMTMADTVVVMRAGRIEQEGPPLALYDRPANRFVAGFIGSPAMNFLPGEIAPDGRHVRLALPGDPVLALGSRRLDAGRQVTVGLRPEHLVPAEDGSGQMTLSVALVEQTGSASMLVTATDPALTVAVARRLDLRPGDPIRLSVDPSCIHLFDSVTEQALSPEVMC
ncbi:carbohydrate ABC transporter ATP-binding protein, CUT1 family [Rubellimicrobium thermophilum DSM 16684]|uniref:Carbohydrate ABC transporter ATP-binding protein, CUT1 family n=1 Tax=Rubellimicrobium thermophilum DSM 16684 TaxID=1123069 RepID=S9R6W4_9RHOB|nr:ABC transporter ATP-binding protein [Rubellimicrobium thermophilum]EPX87728.1 carbohydrate ABC transporter ATP-binding protein, CUT1 family [Rubellimicrobium thermophilum DSM 16684]